MTVPRIVIATLNEGELRKTLTTFRADLTTIYLESETRVVLTPIQDFIGPRITLPPVHWLCGRAFGPNLEIRWHTDRQGAQNNQFEVMALTESNAGPQNWQASGWTLLLDSVVKPRNVLLAGINNLNLPTNHMLYRAQPEGGLWIEESIPRPLHYPHVDPKADRVILRCVDYLSRGLVVLTRLREFAPYNKSDTF
jgi:hypothetical protein